MSNQHGPTDQTRPLRPRVVVVGEGLIDVVNGRPHVGGSPLNVAVGAARLGCEAVYLGRTGLDEYGDMVARHLRSNGVIAPMPPDDNPTSVATATLGADGSATYDIQLHWDMPDLGTALQKSLVGARLLHTGSIATVHEPGAGQVLEAVAAARDRGALVTFDPNCRPSINPDRHHGRRSAETFVALSTLVKVSEEDLRWLYPDADLEEAAASWLRLGPSLVVVTLGGQGALALTPAGTVRTPAMHTQVVDTVGAGDSFMASLLAQIASQGHHPSSLDMVHIERLLHRAACAAAITVSRAGANPPTLAELETFDKINSFPTPSTRTHPRFPIPQEGNHS
ncbi:MAG: carbohydrate kinase [Corynebacterium sp.]|uniref:carbohydrate kinase family protein n=1 Tax=Corynebacterium sp. TaxID=1720 RepID=UPI0026DFA1B8|nr:carbohydrate kinase [Corynebacterium sp.]MDO5670125.1 carbohydrate kinase [Corynebacterium sp.]